MRSTPKTFQRRLILYNLLIVICIASAVSFSNHDSYRKNVIVAETKSNQSRINGLSARTGVAYDETVNTLLSCSERKSLFLITTFPEYREGYSNLQAAVYAASVLRDLCVVSGYTDAIYKITLYSNGLVLRTDNTPGATDDPERIMATPWFQKNLEKTPSQYALELIDNPFSMRTTCVPKTLPLLHPLQNALDKPEGCWVFLSISPILFQRALEALPKESILYVITFDGDLITSQNGDIYDNSVFQDRLLEAEDGSGNFQITLNRKKCVITYEEKLLSDLIFCEIVPLFSMNLGHVVVYNIVFLVFLFYIIIGLTLPFVISRQLGAPINQLTKRLRLVVERNLEPDPSIKTNDEVGIIGVQINRMSNQISNLLDSRVQNEKEKEDMEIKVLQAQINPHFLYNTLNSIEWTATIQKNTGIAQVVTTLSPLLKNMAKGFNEKVTFRQEFEFLQNYVTIEKIRYIELLDVGIQADEENFCDARIVKLTLQPIVENTIFPGVESNGQFGLIQIHAFAKDGIFCVTVRDNGVSISPENIQKLLTDTSRIMKSNMSGTGLPNVDGRLKLMYGEDYGITIESEMNNYTMITISLPLKYES